MRRDTKLLLFDISGFYVLGIGLLALNYVLNKPSIFLIVMLFWGKMTVGFVLIGMAYWLYCIIMSFRGFPVNAPIPGLRKAYLIAGATLLVFQLIRFQHADLCGLGPPLC